MDDDAKKKLNIGLLVLFTLVNGVGVADSLIGSGSSFVYLSEDCLVYLEKNDPFMTARCLEEYNLLIRRLNRFVREAESVGNNTNTNRVNNPNLPERENTTKKHNE